MLTQLGYLDTNKYGPGTYGIEANGDYVKCGIKAEGGRFFMAPLHQHSNYVERKRSKLMQALQPHQSRRELKEKISQLQADVEVLSEKNHNLNEKLNEAKRTLHEHRLQQRAKFTVGDVVRFRAGGNAMVVAEEPYEQQTHYLGDAPPLIYVCRWWDPCEQTYQHASFEQDTLIGEGE